VAATEEATARGRIGRGEREKREQETRELCRFQLTLIRGSFHKVKGN